MPPSIKYTTTAIIDAGMQVIEKKGYAALSIRKISEKFGGSTQPVYSHFASKEDLDAVLLDAIFDKLLAYTRESYTRHAFLNIGVGIALFGRDHPKLYQTLFLNPDFSKSFISKLLKHHLSILRNTQDFANFSDKEIETLVFKRWIYIYGLATLISFGLFEKPTKQNIMHTIKSSGLPVIRDAIERNIKRSENGK